jgi:hypothetical protein
MEVRVVTAPRTTLLDGEASVVEVVGMTVVTLVVAGATLVEVALEMVALAPEAVVDLITVVPTKRILLVSIMAWAMCG